MKILLLSTELPPRTGFGGIGTYTSIIAPALARRGHEVHILSCAEEQDSTDHVDEGVETHLRPLLRFPGLKRTKSLTLTLQRLDMAYSCMRHLGRLNTSFDVVESPDWMAESLFVRRSSGAIVAHVHSPLFLIARHNDVKGHDVGMAARLERRSLVRADSLTFPSTALLTELSHEGWIRQGVRTAVIPQPIDLKPWASLPDASATPQVVLMVGRIEPRKGVDLILHALSSLLPQVLEGLTLRLVGRSSGTTDGMPHADWIRNLAERLQVPCDFVGEVSRSELPQQFAGARVVAMPSRWESFGMVVPEAMASGRPVVCTATVGASELLTGSQAGKVVVSTAQALAQAIGPYLMDADVARDAGEAGRKLVKDRCSPDVVAGAREQLYLQTIAQRIA